MAVSIKEGPEAELSAQIWRGEVFTIHATRDDRRLITHRIIPDIAVAQAQQLNDAGWCVHISGLGGREFKPSEFYQLVTHERIS